MLYPFSGPTIQVYPHKKYGIYRLKEDKPVLIKDITSTEAEQLINSQMYVNRFQIMRDHLVQTEMSFIELIESAKIDYKYISQKEFEFSSYQRDRGDLINVNRLCKNYVFSFFSSVELREKQISKDLGKEGTVFFNEWKKMQKHYYNTHFEFRFIYQLRNFCHINNPVNALYGFNSKITALCNKTDLLHLKQYQKPIFKVDWLRLPENFNIFPIVQKSIQYLSNLSDDHMRLNKDLFLSNANYILTQYGQISKHKIGVAEKFSPDFKYVQEIQLTLAEQVKKYYL